MADRVLFIGWGAPAAGTEERSLVLLNRILGLFSRMRHQRRIQGYDVGLLERTGDPAGFIRLRGSAEQISAIRHDEEFQRAMLDASQISHRSYLVEGDANEELGEQVARYRSEITGIPSHLAAPPAVGRPDHYGSRRVGGSTHRSIFGALPAALTRS